MEFVWPGLLRVYAEVVEDGGGEVGGGDRLFFDVAAVLVGAAVDLAAADAAADEEALLENLPRPARKEVTQQP